MAAADHTLASQLGIQVRAVLDLRTGADSPLTKGVHWTEGEGGKVTYTEAGTALVRELTSSDKKKRGGAPEAVNPWTTAAGVGPDATAGKKEGGPTGPIGEAKLLVILTIYPNPLWVLVLVSRAAKNQPAVHAKVRVRNNKKLRRGLQLKCRAWADGRWECCHAGQNVPLKPLPQPVKEEA